MEATVDYDGHRIFESEDGCWQVGTRLSNGQIAVYDRTPYASEEAATREAKRRHHEKPFMHFVAVRA